ncbi:Hypothetical Protein FCC1311_038532 [Hondaea fermentalgiana]|uniref:DUF2855 family protein n=1 Tax=Hondaea fermentalgiana TaxID=2315210 RepID=A0A2R5G9C0_9STRA|nr:Hypothetical Protein FCC1311_038532 [Hondaea fermentalgiana]|eukprot:GBG27630.1 Hypothetical Protein FCC1311_038532 [Hondaea fermentalgiana]
MSEFLVGRDALSRTQVRQRTALEIREGEVLVEIEKCAFTANNVTYGLSGENMRYFDFFPTGSAYLAAIPSWGIARVVVSRAEGIRVGERLYGFLPYAQYAVLKASTVRPNQFIDLSPHRRDLARIYNTYSRIDAQQDPLYVSRDLEDLMILMRPLFLTSWLLMDYAANDMANESQGTVLLTSASSKTAIGMAYLLKYHRPENSNADLRTVGLTSASNVDFVKRIGLYDEVVAYDDAETFLGASNENAEAMRKHKGLLVDMSGNGKVLQTVLSCLPNASCCRVGLTHWDQDSQGPGKFFFAPTYAEEVVRRIGAATFDKTTRESFAAYLEDVKRNNWCQVQKVVGADALKREFTSALETGFDPSQGMVVTLWPSSDVSNAKL